jgi:hypothetical protein
VSDAALFITGLLDGAVLATAAFKLGPDLLHWWRVHRRWQRIRDDRRVIARARLVRWQEKKR